MGGKRVLWNVSQVVEIEGIVVADQGLPGGCVKGGVLAIHRGLMLGKWVSFVGSLRGKDLVWC